MNKISAFRSLCATTILPAAAALVFASTGGSAYAALSDGQAAIEAHLTPQFIPTLKAPVQIIKAKSADLLLAVSLAVADPGAATVGDIGEAAVATEGGKGRADKNKIAGQVLATIVASGNLSGDANAIATITGRIFNANASDTKNKLTAAGQSATIASALKVAAAPTAGNNVGQTIAGLFSGDTALLVSNTITALGTSSPAAKGALTNFVDGLFDANEVAAAGREAFAKAVADKVAAKNAAGAGAVYGGLVLNNPNSAYDSDGEIQTLATNVLGDTKAAKAVGEIIASISGGVVDRAAMSVTLNGGRKDAVKGLITQGLLRSATGATEVNGIINGAGTPANKTTFAAAVAVGSGNDVAKIDAITEKLAGGNDVKTKTAIGQAIIGAVGLSTPDAAKVVTQAIFDSAGGGFADDASRLKFGTDIAGKLKTYAAVGYLAAGIVERSTSQAATTAASIAGTLMGKASKSATDIARQVSALTVSGADKVLFTDILATANAKFVQDAAKGVSLTDPANAGAITARAITHNNNSDKAAIAKAATIATAVAGVVDEETTSEIGAAVIGVMSDGGKTAGKPVKLSLTGTLATGLAKAIQTKPGVKLVNRMDELGELAASLTQAALGKSATDKAQTTLIATIGSNILKSLNKVATLKDNPNLNTSDGLAAKLVATTQTLKADLWEARDIAGSIAETIFRSSLSPSQKAALLGTGIDTAANQGPLLSAFLKLAGKKGSLTYQAVIQAFVDVRAGNGVGKFENGLDTLLPHDKETDHVNG